MEEKTMSISKIVGPFDGFLGGKWRGGRGEAGGVVARSGLMDGDGDDAITTAASSAHSGTAMVRSTFQNILCVKSIELREDGTGIERRGNDRGLVALEAVVVFTAGGEVEMEKESSVSSAQGW
uniref:Uncharacterized protein n=1 Tax=Oryza glumipatula TaxID=40148 RepID=A0A0E0B9X4_9ORYZ